MSVVSVPKTAGRSLALAVAVTGAVLSLSTPAAAQPLLAEDFVETAVQGLGDRYNSHTWATAWWKDKLYVGTGRATFCVQQAMVAYIRPDLAVYPPGEVEVACTPDPHDLPLQAEIWTWTPETNAWDLVYRSPNDVPILGTSPQKYTARDIGFRGMLVFKEQDGTEALYVSGVASRGNLGDGFNGLVPPPRILRSTDGVNFAPIPQDPGTVLGDTMVSGFRNLLRLNGKMYLIGSVGLLGHGIIYEATNPEQGNDAFRQISPPGKTFFEIEKFKGFLYAGTGVNPQNDPTPFSVLKTDGVGETPLFTTVIPTGAYKNQSPSSAVIAMQKFKGRLYVGTDRELLRINPDDTWDLVVGSIRSTPEGRKLEPLSGFDVGFDNVLNIHMWRMTKYGGSLYVGTHDQGTKWKNLVGSDFLRPRMGADIFSSPDGWNFAMVTRDGLGDMYNSGIRALSPTPHGLIMGTANHYYGTRIYKASLAARALPPPQQLAAETLRREILLSWAAAPGATRYHIWRDTGFGVPEEVVAVDAVPGSLQTHLDTTVSGFKQYHYYVVAEDALGRPSAPSTMVTTPYGGPLPTFASLQAQLAAWGAPTSLGERLQRAHDAVRVPRLDQALQELALLRLSVQTTPGLLPVWRSQDLDMLLARFERRVSLVKIGALPARWIMR